jgi:hypothetical protein
MIAAPIGMVSAMTLGMDRRGGGRVCGRETLKSVKSTLMLHKWLVCVTVGLGSVTRRSVPNE